jgi:hypothetical protein
MATQHCVCGARYDADIASEVKAHEERHDVWTSGLAVPVLPSDRVVAQWDDTEVLLITAAAPDEQRERAAKAAERAMLDTPFHTPAFTLEDADPDVRIFLGRRLGRGVALAVLRPRPRWAWWSWDDYDAERRPSTAVAPLTTWAVDLIWTLPRAQQRGLAQRILEVASANVEQPIPSFGWRRPFTPSGEAFVRRLCPEGFWIPA